jgi:transcriptional regulator with XRE-family HTH domain
LQEENIVKKTCKELGITQKELAEIMGVSRQTVTNWATNRVEKPKILFKIVELLTIKNKYEILEKTFKSIQD